MPISQISTNTHANVCFTVYDDIHNQNSTSGIPAIGPTILTFTRGVFKYTKTKRYRYYTHRILLRASLRHNLTCGTNFIDKTTRSNCDW